MKKNKVRIYNSNVGGHQPVYSLDKREYLTDEDIPKLNLSSLHFHEGTEDEEPGYYNYPVGSNPYEIQSNWGIERTGIEDSWDLFTWGAEEGSIIMQEAEKFAHHCKEVLGRVIVINCY